MNNMQPDNMTLTGHAATKYWANGFESLESNCKSLHMGNPVSAAAAVDDLEVLCLRML